MDSKLFLKDRQREERVDGIKAFWVFLVAALHLAIMPRRVRKNELVLDSKIKGSFSQKESGYPVCCWKNGLYILKWPDRKFCVKADKR